MAEDMRTVESADGCVIAWYPGSGVGPRLLCVGGAFSGRTLWDGLIACLPGVPVHVVERRGHGLSADRPGSGPADEVADVHAVLREIGEPVVLVGHSSGALLALRAAVDAPLVRGVVAYEPPPPPPIAGVEDRLRALLAAGDRAGAVTRFLVDAVGMPERLARARLTAPGAESDLAMAHTLVHDVQLAEESVPAEPSNPVLLLLGDQSPPRMADHLHAVAQRLPHAVVRSLPGQAHFALTAAPELIAPHVLEALTTRL
ncbi:alpha/beta fold hydrolase [Labedaea rhizosphaerae]|uniref:Pimeloyl-ACP methyl ester carboxylesterase n=1 Tax=Labedaea rhizosphaerae TaxID=598644 RepID=A0A4R6SGB8_LABRH|nr:alpha/beta hydrolase [Labedaea rhizosphaerae]TDQ00587.1 pimeloyl-ACP methyl ester carboxylesterase [Labedaea rhizosphaerae]